RMRKRSDFGALPRSMRTASSNGPSHVQKVPSAHATATVGPVEEVRAKAAIEKAPPTKEAKLAVEQRVFFDPAAAAGVGGGLLKPSHHRTSHARRRRMNRKSVMSLLILLGAVATFVIGSLLGRTPGAEGIAGL